MHFLHVFEYDRPMSSPFYSPGYEYRGFEVLKARDLPELKAHLIELKHRQSGASVLFIENDDPENLFCLSFQTLPSKSDGVAHILEHTVLCGSEKFPIKDPFFAMGRRSLNTFMNALTGSDFTCYPAATQNKKDFYNLLEVYLDAVFHPELKELSFMQEGHRLEFEVPEDPKSPLTYKGVVFNEMKGALNSGAARMHEAMNHALFPDITYGVNSGGAPEVIPHLTYQELLDFHQTYYHPSRCLFFFYGSFPLAERLDFIADKELDQVKKAPPLPQIPYQPRFTTPQKIIGSYPIGEDENPKSKTLISFGWLTCSADDQETCLALDTLEMILLDTDASPLKKKLLQSKLCKQVTSYLDTELHEVPFIIDLKGCNAEDADKLEKVLFEALESIAREGFDPEAYENALHQEEFHRSEISGDHYPFGLSLFMRSALSKQHGGAPEQGLMIHGLFDTLRKKLADNPRYLCELIQRYLIDNPHRVQIILIPDPALEKKEAESERRILDEIQKALSPAETVEIIQQAEKLKAFQAQQEKANLEVLPKVTLDDAAPSARDLPLSEESIGNLSVFHHDCFTNEIAYADLLFDLPPLTLEEMPYVRLLSVIFSQMGTKQQSYEELLNALQANTGGISAYLTLQVKAENENLFQPAFGLRGKALYRKLPELFTLMKEMVREWSFQNPQRLKEVLQKHLSSLDSHFNQSAIRYATSLSSSCLSHPNMVSEHWYGIRYLEEIRNIDKHFDAEQLIQKLETLAERILMHGKPQLILSMDNDRYQQLKKEKFFGLTAIKTLPGTPWSCNYPLPHVESQARAISSPVAFISHAFKTTPYIHPDAAALRAAAHLFENVVLHQKIREEGGAYGGGAVSNGASGNFYFYSYRDPHIVKTLMAFKSSIEAIANGKFEESDLEEAKFEMIQDLDAPIAPGNRAEVAFSWNRSGKTLEVRQAFRTALLALTPETIAEAVRKWIVPNYANGKTIVFAGKALIEKENKILKDPLPLIGT